MTSLTDGVDLPQADKDTTTAGRDLLELADVSIGFGSTPDVLSDLNIVVREGEFVTVIGPSGCGKSTILNVVAGLMAPRRGSAKLLGVPVSGVNTSVGYMTQGDTLLPWRSVYDNVALPLKLRRVPKPEIARRVEAALEMLELGDARHKFPSQLSGGMKRRALLGRSMIYEPQILLMDEPFAALDPQLRAQMHRELLETVHKLGQTVLFVTHDIHEAVLLSDRVLVLGGRPARVAHDIEVRLGVQRLADDLRFRDDFVELERRVHQAIHPSAEPIDRLLLADGDDQGEV